MPGRPGMHYDLGLSRQVGSFGQVSAKSICGRQHERGRHHMIYRNAPATPVGRTLAAMTKAVALSATLGAALAIGTVSVGLAQAPEPAPAAKPKPPAAKKPAPPKPAAPAAAQPAPAPE